MSNISYISSFLFNKFVYESIKEISVSVIVGSIDYDKK